MQSDGSSREFGSPAYAVCAEYSAGGEEFAERSRGRGGGDREHSVDIDVGGLDG